MHFVTTASVLPFLVLEWDDTHLALVLLCIRTHHLKTAFITELHFRCFKSRWFLEWGRTHFVRVLLCVKTYHLMACFILSSRLSLCTATSMRAIAGPLSSLAVTSMRSVHRCPSLCMSIVWMLVQGAFISQQHNDPHSPNERMGEDR